MKCKNIQNLLSAYLDNNINQNKKNLIEQHLQNCTECSTGLSFLKQTKNILSNLTPVKLPENFTLELQQKLEYFKKEQESMLENYNLFFWIKSIFRKIELENRKNFILYPIRTIFSVCAIILITLGVLFTFNISKKKIPLNILLLAHYEEIKNSSVTNHDILTYISANIKCETNNIILTSDNNENNDEENENG